MSTDTQAQVPALRTGGSIQPIVPQNIEEIWRVAGILYKSGMAPKALDSQEKTMAVLMQGQEVGLPAMAALQSIAMINGRPTIWGDGALGLVQGSGKMEWIKEWYEGDPNTDSYTAHCHVKRKGDPEVKMNSFSIAQAKKAKLWTKQGPWTDYPMRQLKMRPRSWSLRDGFSDVLKGIGIAEEVQDIPPEHVEHTVVSSEPLAKPAEALVMPTVKPPMPPPEAATPAIEHAPGVEYLDEITRVVTVPKTEKRAEYYGIYTLAHGKRPIGTFDAGMAERATTAIKGDKIEIVYSIDGERLSLVRIGPAVAEGTTDA